MRRCAVQKCANSDSTALCHRFPKNSSFAEKWQTSLDLNHIHLDTLMSKFTVCYLHFECIDYRNPASNSINLNAVPKLKAINPRKDASKNKKNQDEEELQSPTNWPQLSLLIPDSPADVSDSIELLHEDTDDATEVDDSIMNTPCSGDDIFILPEEQNAADALIQSVEGAGFTMLDATSCTFMSDSRAHEVDDDSSILKLQNNSYSVQLQEFRPDESTDSDVEVLISESTYESPWSETDCSAIVIQPDQKDTTDSARSPCEYCCLHKSTKTHEPLDPEYGHLEKKQLVDIIKSQSIEIKELQQTISTFKSAQDKLAVEFEVFRKTVSSGNKLEAQ